MTDFWTIRSVVAWSSEDFAKRSLDSPRLDAELLVAHALGIDRVQLYMDLDRPLTPEELAAVRGLVARRRQHEPVAYIRGQREFYGLQIQVGPEVLVPRPETETLVERALDRLPAADRAHVLDVGTGSGCVSVALLAHRPLLEVTGVDISSRALRLAAANADRHGVAERFTPLTGNLYEPLPAGSRFSLIVSNPPYISQPQYEGLSRDIREHEPVRALVAGEDGLDVIRGLVSDAASHLTPQGSILLEIGAGQADDVEELCLAAALDRVQRHLDLAGVERVIEARAP